MINKSFESRALWRGAQLGVNKMKKYLFILLLIIPQVVFAQQEDNLDLTFSSPEKSCILKYKGERRGTGSYYHILGNGETQIYKGYFHYGPIVKWVSNNVAELRMPSGSPNYNSYFYDCQSNIMSPEYMLPIAADTVNGTVATLDEAAIIFFKLFTKNIVYKRQVPNLEPMGFLVFCEPKARFDQNGTFILNYKCPNQSTKTISIKKELLHQTN